MMSRCKLNERSLSIILHNINNCNTLSHNTNIISILNKNNTVCKGGVETLEVEDNNKEEDLVEEEAKSYVIIVGNQKILINIVKVLRKFVHIVKHLITLSNSVHSLLRNGRIELSLTPTQCRIRIQTPIQIFK